MALDTFVKTLSGILFSFSFHGFLVTFLVDIVLTQQSVTLQYQIDLTECLIISREVFSSLHLGQDGFLKLPLFMNKFV